MGIGRYSANHLCRLRLGRNIQTMFATGHWGDGGCVPLSKKQIGGDVGNYDSSLTPTLLTKRSSYDTTAIVRLLTPRRNHLKA